MGRPIPGPQGKVQGYRGRAQLLATSQSSYDHNLSAPLSLQPQLPPDLSIQGKEMQTFESPSLARADSSQGTVQARNKPGL